MAGMGKLGQETVMVMIPAHQKTKNRISDYLLAVGEIWFIPYFLPKLIKLKNSQSLLTFPQGDGQITPTGDTNTARGRLFDCP